MLLEGQNAESRTVSRKKGHNSGRFSGIYVLRPWNPLKYILPSHRQKTKTLKGRTKDATYNNKEYGYKRDGKHH